MEMILKKKMPLYNKLQEIKTKTKREIEREKYDRQCTKWKEEDCICLPRLRAQEDDVTEKSGFCFSLLIIEHDHHKPAWD